MVIGTVCVDAPPPASPGSVSSWNRFWYRVGMTVTYYCSDLPEANIEQVALCDIDRKWKIIYNHSCECLDTPPEATFRIYRLWDSSYYTGASALYFCSTSSGSNILLTYVCMQGKWVMVYRGRCETVASNMSCVAPPPLPFLYGYIEVPATRRQVGSLVTYKCKFNRNQVYRITLCDEHLVWRTIYRGECAPKCDQESKVDARRVREIARLNNPSIRIGVSMVEFCTTKEVSKYSASISQTYICFANGTWARVFDSLCTFKLPLAVCKNDLPYHINSLYLMSSTEVEMGAIRNYTCIEGDSETIARTYRCSDWGKWIMVNSSACFCDPLFISSKYSVSMSKDFFVKTRINVSCSNDPESPLRRTYFCSPTLHWIIKDHTSCRCPRAPRIDYPITLQWNSTFGDSPVYGSRLRYTCDPNPASSVKLVFRCSHDPNTDESFWEEIENNVCPLLPSECLQDPIRPPQYAKWDWDGKMRDVGTVIIYYCHNDEARVLMMALCSVQGRWNMKYSIQSCGCVVDPPLAPAGISRVWNGETYFGTVIYYLCRGNVEGIRILRTVVCTVQGYWKQIFRGSCRPSDYAECIHDKPDVSQQHFVMWEPAESRSGATIIVSCHVQAPFSLDNVNVVYVCEALTQRWIEAQRGICGCLSNPVETVWDSLYLYQMVWRGYRSLGSSAANTCINPVKSPAREIVHCFNDSWVQIHQGACACYGLPSAPSPYSVRIWDNSNLVGANVTFLCSSHIDSPIEQVYTCRSSGQWIPIFEDSSHHCMCLDPPSPIFPIRSDWDEISHHVGLQVKYMCNDQVDSPVIATISCYPNLEWIMISNMNWTEQLIRSEQDYQEHQYHYVSSYEGKYSDPMVGNLTTGMITNVCNGLITYGLPFKPDWKNLQHCRCECLEDPPLLGTYILHNTGSKIKYVGTKLMYWCSEQRSISFTVVCTPELLWKKDNFENDVCVCRQAPLTNSQLSNYAFFLHYKTRENRLGSVAVFRCTQDPASPIVEVSQCVYKADGNVWMTIYESGISRCRCNGSWPDPPIRVPPLKIVKISAVSSLVGEPNWIGNKLRYECSDDPMTGIYMVVQCHNDAKWKIVTFFGRCIECEGDPPTGPGFRNWDGSRLIGSIVSYHCTEDVASPHAMDWECDRQNRTWQIIYSGSCVCHDFPDYLPPPLTIQHDFSQQEQNYIGIPYEVTCTKDRNSPLVDVLVCDIRKEWKRKKDDEPEWVDLRRDICVCSAPPTFEDSKAVLGSLKLSEADAETSSWYIDTQVSYRCQTHHDSPVALTLVCTTKKTWDRIYVNEDACVCPDDPPPAEDETYRNWNGDRSVGTIIQYTCVIHSPISKYTYNCDAGHWYKMDGLPDECECKGDVIPLGEYASVMHAREVTLTKHMHDKHEFYCSSNPLSPLFVVVTCSLEALWEVTYPVAMFYDSTDEQQELTWDELYEKHCSCTDDMPLVPFGSNIYKNVSEGFQIGSTVTYQCKEDSTEPYYRKLICSPSREWQEIGTLNKTDCMCHEPVPEVILKDVHMNWNSNRYIGTRIEYLCDDPMETIFQEVECSPGGTWKFILPPNPDGTCTCPDQNVTVSYGRVEWDGSRTPGAQIMYFCSDNPSDDVLYYYNNYILQCQRNRTWTNTLNKKCFCPEELPEYDEVGDLPSSLYIEPVPESALPGSTVKAYCVKHLSSPSFVLYHCNVENVMWNLTADIFTIYNETCTCTANVTEATSPRFRKWDGSTRMKSEVEYHCTSSPQSPIYQRAMCTYDRSWNMWYPEDDEILIARRCYCTFPPVPILTSRKLQVITHASTTDLVYIGESFEYRCDFDLDSAKYAIYKCTENLTWHITPLSTCECINSPLPADILDIVEHMPHLPVLIGETVDVYCSRLSDSKLLFKTFNCTNTLILELANPSDANKSHSSDCTCQEHPSKKLWNIDEKYMFEDSLERHDWFVGTILRVFCNENSTNVYMTIKCSDERKWVESNRSAEICDCIGDPPVPKQTNKFVVGLRESYSVGNVITYRCSNKFFSLLMMEMHCGDNRKWNVSTPEQSCLCKDDSLAKVPARFDLVFPEVPIVGAYIEVKCTTDDHSPVLQYMQCSEWKEWKLVYNGSFDDLEQKYCSCSEPEEHPKFAMEYNSTILNSVVLYNCSVDPRHGVAMKRTCVVTRGRIVSWVEELLHDCDCNELPPEAIENEFRNWPEESMAINTTIVYNCNSHIDSPIKYLVICVRENEGDKTPIWKADEQKLSCRCGFLEQVEGFVLSYFPFDNNEFGSIARYSCASDLNATVVQELRCNENGGWTLMEGPSAEELDESLCECKLEEDPEFYDREGPFHIGDEVVLRCIKNNSESGFAKKLLCSHDGEWTELDEGVCECPPLPPFVFPVRVVTTPGELDDLQRIGSNHTIVCEHEGEFHFLSSIHCNVSKQWVYNVSMISCACKEDPPESEMQLLHRTWNRQYQVGSMAYYGCVTDDTKHAVMTAVCTIHFTWEMDPLALEMARKENCTCLTDPPPVTSQVTVVWSGSHRIGTEAIYECVPNIAKYTYKCNVSKLWERTEIRPCECLDDPPGTELTIVASRKVGSTFHVPCTEKPSEGLASIYECGSSFNWKKKEQFSCSCSRYPSEAVDGKFFIEQTNIILDSKGDAYVGSEISYKCSRLFDSRVMLVARCVNLDTSQDKGWKFNRDPQSISEEELDSYCSCPEDPPAPQNHTGWDWSGDRSEESQVSYFCSPETTDVPIASATCDIDHKWKLETDVPVDTDTGIDIAHVWGELIERYCVCGPPPPTVGDSTHYTWDEGVEQRVGSVVTYWCTESQEAYNLKLRCDNDGKYVMAAEGNCEYRYCSTTVANTSETRCLYYSFTPESYMEAFLSCMQHQMELVTINSYQADRDVVNCAFPASKSCSNFFFYIQFNSGIGRWEIGSRRSLATYDRWVRTRNDDEHCAAFDNQGLWHPVTCSSNLCYMCSAPADAYYNCRRKSDRLPLD